MKNSLTFKLQWYLAILLLSISTHSFSQTVTQYTYGSQLIDEGYSIFQTQDSLLIFTGYTDSLNAQGLPEENVYVGKITETGNHLWTRGYRINSHERGYSIIESQRDTTDEYVVVGDVLIAGSVKTNRDAFLMRLDTSGNVLSLTRYGTTLNEHARSVIRIDSGYVFVGYTNANPATSNGGVNNDVYLVRTDFFGNQLWAKSIDIDSRDDYGFDIIQKDTTYYITGNSMDTTSRTSQSFLMNVDFNGSVQWIRLYGDSLRDDFSYSLKETINDGIIMIGHTFGYSSILNSKVFVVNTDAAGASQWYGVYDFAISDSGNFGRDILVSPDSSYYGIGHSWVRDALGFNKTIFQLDFAGGLTWVKSFGDSLEERGYAGWLLPNTVVGLGTTFSFNSSAPDAYFVSTTLNDSLECVDFVPLDSTIVFVEQETAPHISDRWQTVWIRDSSRFYSINLWNEICLDSAKRIGVYPLSDLTTQDFDIQVYPNPSNGQFNIHSSSIYDQNLTLTITDLTCRVIEEQNLYSHYENLPVQLIQKYSPGIYMAHISFNNKKFVFKFVINQ